MTGGWARSWGRSYRRGVLCLYVTACTATVSAPHPKPTPAQIAFSITRGEESNILYFFNQTPQLLLFFSLFVLVHGLLLEGGIYFIGKLADSKDG